MVLLHPCDDKGWMLMMKQGVDEAMTAHTHNNQVVWGVVSSVMINMVDMVAPFAVRSRTDLTGSLRAVPELVGSLAIFLPTIMRPLLCQKAFRVFCLVPIPLVPGIPQDHLAMSLTVGARMRRNRGTALQADLLRHGLDASLPHVLTHVSYAGVTMQRRGCNRVLEAAMAQPLTAFRGFPHGIEMQAKLACSGRQGRRFVNGLIDHVPINRLITRHGLLQNHIVTCRPHYNCINV